jgi:predicted nucleotidyltransferase component of viral defense system
VAPEITRSQRSRTAEGARKVLEQLPSGVPVFSVDTALKGANNSTQYNAVIGYDSPLSGDHDTIKVEIGLREMLLDRPVQGLAQTLLVNPISRERSVPPFPVACLSFAESFAEKLRAALTRRDAAIRDYYDIDFAVRTLGLRLEDKAFVDLARLKLSVPRTPAPDTSDERLQILR